MRAVVDGRCWSLGDYVHGARVAALHPLSRARRVLSLGFYPVLDGFMARRADLKPLLYDEFSTAQRVLDGDTDV